MGRELGFVPRGWRAVAWCRVHPGPLKGTMINKFEQAGACVCRWYDLRRVSNAGHEGGQGQGGQLKRRMIWAGSNYKRGVEELEIG